MAVWPDEISTALERHEVVAITSGLTDLREAEALLEQRLPGRWLRIEWGMGSASNRARFHEVQQASGFPMLPMFIGRDGLIGGVPELREHLGIAPAVHGQPSTLSHDDRTILFNTLGYGGLIPFAFFGIAAWFGPSEWQSFALHALAVYAAVILSFLGAVHWGLSLVDRGHRVLVFSGPAWAVIPSILAWVALLLPKTPALLVLLLLFPLLLWVDRASLSRLPMPQGYLILRRNLTLVAMLFLLSGTVASFTF